METTSTKKNVMDSKSGRRSKYREKKSDVVQGIHNLYFDTIYLVSKYFTYETTTHNRRCSLFVVCDIHTIVENRPCQFLLLTVESIH